MAMTWHDEGEIFIRQIYYRYLTCWRFMHLCRHSVDTPRVKKKVIRHDPWYMAEMGSWWKDCRTLASIITLLRKQNAFILDTIIAANLIRYLSEMVHLYGYIFMDWYIYLSYIHRMYERLILETIRLRDISLKFFF